MLRSFFSYTQPAPPPEVPKEEIPDPNADRDLSEPYRNARRSLVALCAVCLTWASAQFNLEELSIDAAGLKINLQNVSIPLLLSAGLIYLSFRWGIEFAMLPRSIRRWRLARLDFQIVSLVARFSLLSIAAGAIDRSSRGVFTILACLAALTITMVVLTLLFLVPTTLVRMRARSKANRPSAVNAVSEGFAWASFFSIALTVLGAVALAIASYYSETVRLAIWPSTSDPLAVTLFVLLLVAVFLSHWFFKPLMQGLFAERPGYYTERSEDGKMNITFVNQKDEPLL